MASNGAGRTRNYATVVYPESAPADWFDILVGQFIPAFVSPLHEFDVNPTGEVKKAHYHVLLMFDSVKTNEQAKEIFDLIGGVGCERVNSLRGYARYLCHLDNPEKHQYDRCDVRSLCGSDYNSVINLTTDKYVAVGEIMDYCYENHITSYAQLLIYARTYKYDWFRVLCDSGTVVVREFLKSLDWTMRVERINNDE